MRRDELFAFVEIPPEVLTASGSDEPRLQYYTQYPTYQALPDWLRREVSRAVADRRLSALGADPAETRRLLEPVPMDRKGLVVRTADGKVSTAEKVDALRAFAMPAIAMFLLFGLVMSSAPQLLNSVIEEKTSRISEVLLGSVSAFHLMLGKLLGSVAVTMVLAVIYIGGGLLIAAQADYFGLIRWSLIPWFGLFLVIAVFLYGAMFIAIGAACSEVKDAQGMMMPAMILAMFPIFLWLQVAQNPDSAMSVGFSLFPFAVAVPDAVANRHPAGAAGVAGRPRAGGQRRDHGGDGLCRGAHPARRPADAGQDGELSRDGALDHGEVGRGSPDVPTGLGRLRRRAAPSADGPVPRQIVPVPGSRSPVPGTRLL